MPRPALVVLVAASLALVTWGLWPAGPETDEDRIRAVIAAMAEATQERDVGDLLEHVSASYEGELGDRSSLRRYAAGTFLRSEAVVAVPSGVEVEVQGARAQVALRLTLARSPNAGVDDALGSHLVDAEFVREDGEWRVVSAKRR